MDSIIKFMFIGIIGLIIFIFVLGNFLSKKITKWVDKKKDKGV